MKKLYNKVKRFIEFRRKNITVWSPCNIYPSAKIGKNVSIGMFSEIGPNVIIGENTRIGMGSFIPEGVEIGKNVFIGPRVTFTNDIYPPSPRSQWQKTFIHDDVSIGASVSVRAGVIIGKKALIGMGSAVIKNIPAQQIWAGIPCKFIRKRN